MKRESDIKTVDELFESVLFNNDEVQDVLSEEAEDCLLEHLEENRKISIFDSEFILEGEE